MEYNDQPWWKLEIKKFFLRFFLSVGTGITALIVAMLIMLVIIKGCTEVMKHSLERENKSRMQQSRMIPKK